MTSCILIQIYITQISFFITTSTSIAQTF